MEGRSVSLFVAMTGVYARDKPGDALMKIYPSNLRKVDIVPGYTAVTACVVESKAAGVGRRSVMKGAKQQRQGVSKTETKNVLTHWAAIRRAYLSITEYEAKRGAKFAWLLRVRPDLVFLSPVTVSKLGLTPHVPFADMWVDGLQSCTNDHVFLCPRDQCRAYFNTIELWESKHCTGSVNEEDPSAPMPLGNDGPPDAPFKLPSPPGGFGSMWLVLRRYGATTCADASSDGCCGPRIKRSSWSYGLARGNNTHGTVQLDRYMPGNSAFAVAGDSNAVGV